MRRILLCCFQGQNICTVFGGRYETECVTNCIIRKMLQPTDRKIQWITKNTGHYQTVIVLWHHLVLKVYREVLCRVLLVQIPTISLEYTYECKS